MYFTLSIDFLLKFPIEILALLTKDDFLLEEESFLDDVSESSVSVLLPESFGCLVEGMECFLG